MNETVQKRMEEERHNIKHLNLEYIKVDIRNDKNERDEIANNPDYAQELNASIERACNHDIFDGESRNAVLNEMSQIGINVNNVQDIDYGAVDIIKLVRNGDISQNDASMLYGDDMSIDRRLCCVDLANALADKRAEGEYHDIGYFKELIDLKYTNDEITQFTDAVQNGRDPLIIAAIHEVAHLDDVFSEPQLSELYKFMDTDISLRKFMVCADPELSPGSMDFLRRSFFDGLGVKTVEALAECCKYNQKHDLGFDNVNFLRNELKQMDAEQRMKANKYILPQFSEAQLIAIMSCVKSNAISGKDIDKIASPDIPVTVMWAMINGFELPGIDKNKIVALSTSSDKSTEVVDKINEYVLNYAVKYYKGEVNRLEKDISKLQAEQEKYGGTLSEAKASELRSCEESLFLANYRLDDSRKELEEITGKKGVKTQVEDKEPAVKAAKATAQAQDKNKKKPDDPDGRD